MAKTLLINIVISLIDVLYILIFARVLLSWFPPKVSKIRLFIFDITEPILKPVRKAIPPMGGVVDLSPIIIFLILEIIQSLIAKI